MKSRKAAFTLVELIVVITILAILGTIAFISLSGYALTSRDTVRVSDINSITKVIELHRLEEGTYPVVTNPIEITFSGGIIWQQGSFGSGSRIDAGRISEVPVDPLTGSEYAYSITQTTAEYQVGTIVEGGLTHNNESSNLYTFTEQTQAASILAGFATTKIKGNYNGKFITQIVGNDIYMLGAPTILSDVVETSTLQEIITNKNFVYQGGKKAPSTYTGTVDNTQEWDFNPAIQGSSDAGVIYEGTVAALSTPAGKVAFVDNIQSYYGGTDVENSVAFKELASIDTSTQSIEAQELVNAYIETEIGGLGEERVAVSTPIVVSGGGGGGGGGVTQWRDIDSNCTEDDIVSGGITMAGCNSTFKDNHYAFSGSEMFGGGEIGNCVGFICPDATAITYTSTLNDFGSGLNDYIFGEQYNSSNKSQACPTGWKIPSVQDYCDILIGLGYDITSCSWTQGVVSIQDSVSNNTSNYLTSLKIPEVGKSGAGAYNFGMNNEYISYVSDADIINGSWIYYGLTFPGGGSSGNPWGRHSGWDASNMHNPVRCVKDL